MSSPLLIDEPPLQVLPSLAMAVGLTEAIILQQVHYWISKKRSKPEKYVDSSFLLGQWWIWNSVAEWQEQFPFWSDNTIRRAINGLRERGILIAERLHPDPYDKTLFYRIDYEALATATSREAVQKGSNRDPEKKRVNRFAQNEGVHLPKMSKSTSSDWVNGTAQDEQRDLPVLGKSSAQNGQMDTPKMSNSLTETSPETSPKNSKQRLPLRPAPAGAPESLPSAFPGEERNGEERNGEERNGEERNGEERNGEERTGKERAGEPLDPAVAAKNVVYKRGASKIKEALEKAKKRAE